MGEYFHAWQSRVGLRNSGGEIVEVQGGHIVRSISRKDRHSKVCTSKGPKDRRVRLSANTAIQFYDVQDRLGYDRPSKAVDWLIKKAKSAIDKLDELPSWKPTINTSSILDFDKNPDQETTNSTPILNFDQNPDQQTTNFVSSMNFDQNPDQETRNHHELSRFGQHPDQNSSFLPPSLDSDSITDTIKSFFPMGASSTPVNDNSQAMQFHQSFSTPQTTPFLQSLFSQITDSHLFNNNSQRGPLQSSYTPSIRGWIDQPPFAGDAVDHRAGFSSSGFSGFFVPVRFQGEQEEHDGISDKPSSASSDSRH